MTPKQFEELNQKLDKIIELLQSKSRSKSISANTDLLWKLIDSKIKDQGYITSADKHDLIAKSGISERTWYRIIKQIPKFPYQGQEVWAYQVPGENSNEMITRETIENIVKELINDFEYGTVELVDAVFNEIGEEHRLTPIGKLVMEICA